MAILHKWRVQRSDADYEGAVSVTRSTSGNLNFSPLPAFLISMQ